MSMSLNVSEDGQTATLVVAAPPDPVSESVDVVVRAPVKKWRVVLAAVGAPDISDDPLAAVAALDPGDAAAITAALQPANPYAPGSVQAQSWAMAFQAAAVNISNGQVPRADQYKIDGYSAPAAVAMSRGHQAAINALT